MNQWTSKTVWHVSPTASSLVTQSSKHNGLTAPKRPCHAGGIQLYAARTNLSDVEGGGGLSADGQASRGQAGQS